MTCLMGAKEIQFCANASKTIRVHGPTTAALLFKQELC